MNRQEIYNKVSRHLLRQKKKSMSKHGHACAYRGQDGLKCAIGVLISNKAYTPCMEGTVASDLLESYSFGVRNTASNRVFLDDLQGVHDFCEPGDWKNGLHQFAEKYGLKK